MHRNIFKLYLTLFFLSFTLNGCYTLLNNPLRVKPIPQIDIHNLEKYDNRNDRDELTPTVNRYYGRQLQYPYAYQYDGYYSIGPYYSNRYNTYGTYYVHDVSHQAVSQTPAQQRTKVEVKVSQSSRDVEKARMVWERRVNPSRVREIPTPIRRQKDGE